MPADERITIRVGDSKSAGHFVLGRTYGLHLDGSPKPTWYGVAVAVDLVGGVVTFEKAPDA